MRRSGLLLLLGVASISLAGCLLPHFRHSAADGWRVEWKLHLPTDSDDDESFGDSTLDSLHKGGYGFNNEKNAQRAMDKARKR